MWSQAAAPLPPDANYGQRVADALGREVQDDVANGAHTSLAPSGSTRRG